MNAQNGLGAPPNLAKPGSKVGAFVAFCLTHASLLFLISYTGLMPVIPPFFSQTHLLNQTCPCSWPIALGSIFGDTKERARRLAKTANGHPDGSGRKTELSSAAEIYDALS